MKLLRFGGLVFVFITIFQFVNIRFYNGAIFSLPSSQDKFLVSSSINRSTEEHLIRPSSASDLTYSTSSSRSAQGETTSSEEDHVLLGSDKNDTNQSHESLEEDDAQDKETLDDLLPGTRSSSSNEKIVEDADVAYENTRKVEILESKSDPLVDNLSSDVKCFMKVSNSGVVSITEMMDLLHQSHTSHVSLRVKPSSTVDQELLYARTQIENPPLIENDPLLHAPLYWNLSMFKRSYELMEKNLKVYVYREGKRPVLHKPVLKGIYASEGWFMKQLKSSKTYVTKNPRKAHLFYLPFSSKMLEETLYVPGSHSDKNLIEFLKNYLDMISSKYNFWNKTGGSDHFLVACHDWAPSETRQYMAKCIRALCNSDVSEGFVFGKDVALPETTILVPRRPLRALGGKPVSQRQILAFFAGGMHGYLRPLLLQSWGGNRDPDMKIFSEIPKSKGKKSYMECMKSTKYCICPKGHEVNSPRVVEALFYECVPVIISDNFVPPFFEVLNWESFAVFVLEKDIPDLKNILLSITEERYREMHKRVKMVQKHFLWHSKPERFDIFHMILHSIWYNRVFQS
ncbi:PREDICTED: probable glycosyltransferase At5g03795 [Camelina sativa]|uniref:Probable glycosyltransferase At5g03795 n=1 Tax=Camelina sativa TaxID=90675 RepID=A0ABM1QM92_CAMSA|nr:PREDICTED: probable glycosyltransferase At5g03795 [Camelina sativa]XP_019087880.1 PREDICTED: probable glycosyltransferase At5g03795 [Camelina sativa]